MAHVQLAKEVYTFGLNAKLMKQLLNETKLIFSEINKASCFNNYSPTIIKNENLIDSEDCIGNDSNSMKVKNDVDDEEATDHITTSNEWSLISCDARSKVNAEIDGEEDKTIKNVYSNLPTLIILSNNPSHRTTILAELLEHDILNLHDVDQIWRSIILKNGSRCRISKIQSENIQPPSSTTASNNPSRSSFSFNSFKKSSSSWKNIISSDDVYGTKDPKSCHLEVHLFNKLLQAGLDIYIPEIRPYNQQNFDYLFKSFVKNNLLYIFVIENDELSDDEENLLKYLLESSTELTIFFIKISKINQNHQPAHNNDSNNNNDIGIINSNSSINNGNYHKSNLKNNMLLEEQLFKLNFKSSLVSLIEYEERIRLLTDSSIELSSSTSSTSSLSPVATTPTTTTPTTKQLFMHDYKIHNSFDGFLQQFMDYVKIALNRMLLKSVNVMINVHLRCLDSTITIAFNMARDGVKVPPRIKFAKNKEEELYNSLMEMAMKKQVELKKMICDTINKKKDELIEKATTCDIVGVELSEEGLVSSSKDLKICSDQIEDFVLYNLNGLISGQLVSSVDVLRESYTGILSRCLNSLEQLDTELGIDSSRTSRALKDILSTAYQVNITVQTNDSFMRAFIEKMKHVLHSIWSRPSMKVDADWKKKVAMEMLSTLNEARCQKLAKSICNQIKERLKKSHHTFEQCLKQLELKHSGRLEKTEEQRLLIRKEYAPRVAKLSLESRSFRDLILHGKPKLGPMIGNGQYGVVFSCESWGGFKSCAVKTMVPPDEKHWNDLAMEFYYTMNIPEHDRIVVLRGSVVDYNYSSSGLAVMLIMDRLDMDLYTAIERKLSWIERLQVSIDVVEGIRYLHSQGLVHRDIKLKNVLIDSKKRGKLTDLGFCKPEALMSGSIVGTPIHMAPELVTGKYDHSVDIYAFGVLFWYICSGTVHLPQQFEKCPSKEILWNCVKRGLRPEKPKNVDPECWELMLACWHSNPDMRPLVGEIELTLRSIYDRVLNENKMAAVVLDTVVDGVGSDARLDNIKMVDAAAAEDYNDDDDDSFDDCDDDDDDDGGGGDRRGSVKKIGDDNDDTLR